MNVLKDQDTGGMIDIDNPAWFEFRSFLSDSVIFRHISGVEYRFRRGDAIMAGLRVPAEDTFSQAVERGCPEE